MNELSGVVRGGRGGKMPQAALALRTAFSVQKSSHKGGIFSSQKQLQRRHFRLKKATLQAAFSVQKSNPGSGIFGSKKQL